MSRLRKLREFLIRYLEQFLYQKKAIVWVWAVVLMAMIVYSIAWFTLGWAAMEVIDAVEASYTFEAPAASTVDLMKTVIAWHPIIVIFGWIIYGYVNSQRRDPRIYQEY